MPGFVSAGMVVTAVPGVAAEPPAAAEQEAPLIAVARGIPLFTVSAAVRAAAAAAQARARYAAILRGVGTRGARLRRGSPGAAAGVFVGRENLRSRAFAQRAARVRAAAGHTAPRLATHPAVRQR
jgi:hypothetical protein